MTTIKRTKDRQYNDHNEKDEGQTIQWPQWKGRRTDNTMITKKRRKDRQYNDIVVIVLSVLRAIYCGHCIVCSSSFLLWSWYCLFFVLFIVVIVLSVLRPFYCGHCIVRTDNAMPTIKRTKDRQYNDHNKKDDGQTMQWPQWKGRRTDNTMTTMKRTKNRQYNDHNKKDEGQTIQWPQ
jgi:hypothetical protein